MFLQFDPLFYYICIIPPQSLQPLIEIKRRHSLWIVTNSIKTNLVTSCGLKLKVSEDIMNLNEKDCVIQILISVCGVPHRKYTVSLFQPGFSKIRSYWVLLVFILEPNTTKF